MRKYCMILLLVASTGTWDQTDSLNKLSFGLELE